MVIRYPNGQSTTYDDGKTKMQEKLIKPKRMPIVGCVLKKRSMKATFII